MPITAKDILDAATRVNNRGINPSQREVRKELGSGSFSTIAAVLRTWKPEEAEEKAPDPAPAAVEDYGRQLAAYAWKIAVDEASAGADERVHGALAAQLRAEEDLKNLAATADELAIENDRLRAEVADLKGRLNKAVNACNAHRQSSVAASAKAETLQAAIDQLTAAIAGNAAAKTEKAA
jgi:hypothetical protein